MNEQERLDVELKAIRLDYDISAYATQVLDHKRKLIESQKIAAVARAAIAELEDKIAGKQLEKEALAQ